MDRFTNQDESAFQPQRVILDIKFAAGSSGAVPTDITGYLVASGIESMSLASTGLYTVHLSDTYIRVLCGSFKVVQASYDATHARMGDITVEAQDDGTDPLVTFQAVNSAGAATAVTAGDIVEITLELQRATGDYE